MTAERAPDLPSLQLPDDEFITTFECGGFGGDAFPHKAHLRMAWLYVTRLGPEAAVIRAAEGIRNLARANGTPGLYHETLTRAWVYLVAAAVAKSELLSFAELLADNPQLLDKRLVLQHYSAEVLSSSLARAVWVAPDVKEIPGAPPSSEDGTEPVSARGVAAADYVAVFRLVPTPVAVISASDGASVHGVTASSVTSLSVDPPLVLVCLQRDSRILPMIRSSMRFGLSFLSDQQGDVGSHFASPQRPSGAEQFHGIPHRAGRFGLPLLSGASAWLVCELWREYPDGDHIIVCGLVTEAAAESAHPLLNYSGRLL
jgi:flavin reductase